MSSPIDELPSRDEVERKYGKIPSNDEIGFIIHDQSSKILSMIPETWRIPLIIISHVKGYNVDEYVLEMIRDRLSMFGDGRDDLGENFQDYMKDVEGLEDTDSKEKYVDVKLDSDLVKRLAKVEQRKLEREESQQQQESDTDDNTKEFVKDVNNNFYSKKEDQDNKEDELK